LSSNIVVSGFNIANVKGLSFLYCSPETFIRYKAKSGFSDKAAVFKAGDVYALGSIIYEILTRTSPWK
jgi:serine/threonine protein kinase